MKRTLFFVVVAVAMTFALIGCKTMEGSMDSYGKPVLQEELKGKTVHEGITISATAYKKGNYISDVDVHIWNDTEKVVVWNIDNSSLVVNGSSNRVVVGETIKANANLQQPVFPIAPNTSLSKTLCNPNSDNFSYGWLFLNWESPRLMVCLNVEGQDCFINVELLQAEEKVAEKIGEVSASFTAWHPFFIGGNDGIAAKTLKNEADAKFGNEVWIENINYEAKWSPLSLALIFNLYGYVQKGTATADVYKWK